MSDLKVLDGLKYTEKHEWVKVDGDTAVLGITDYAQNALGDLVYIDLPKAGKSLTAGNSCGTLESVKAAEDIYSPLNGEVVESNEAVVKDPALVNKDPYSNWMIKLKNYSISDLDALMDSNAYKKYLETLG
ncbi:MAG: glycine cleavage system protein GcvH [Leptospiraceae bacterium]|nr:glycine cleavage system protein GcvH [Leptospiraceae bacterium]